MIFFSEFTAITERKIENRQNKNGKIPLVQETASKNRLKKTRKKKIVRQKHFVKYLHKFKENRIKNGYDKNKENVRKKSRHRAVCFT